MVFELQQRTLGEGKKVKKITVVHAFSVVVFSLGVSIFFINCSKLKSNFLFQNSNINLNAVGALSFASYSSEVRTCNEMQTASGAVAVAQALQNCIDQVGDYGVVQIPKGLYRLQKAIRVTKSVLIQTENLGVDSAPCLGNGDSRCAVLQAVSPMQDIVHAFINVSSANVTLSHIVIDGNKNERNSGSEAATCKTQNNRVGMNLTVGGSAENFTLVGMSTINAVCGSGAEIAPPASNLQVNQTYVAFNGTHNSDFLWSDGLTVLQAQGANVTFNTFVDNTDVDLIFGGCTDCTITNNTIIHSNSFAQSSFAAAMFHAWPSTSGDYRNSNISDNSIDCGNYRCGFGFLIGAYPWYAAPTQGGTYDNNRIRGAQIGLAINDATNAGNPVLIGRFDVSSSGGTFPTSSGLKFGEARYITSVSLPNVQFINGSSAGQFSVNTFTNSIANWWTTDWVNVSGAGPSSGGSPSPSPAPTPGPSPAPAPQLCNSVTQPAPHFGVKDNQCLKSCGALAGTLAKTQACSVFGLADAGAAYDVEFCCKPAEVTSPVPVPTPAPAPAPTPTPSAGGGSQQVFMAGSLSLNTWERAAANNLELVMQNDGNLVIYPSGGVQAIWSSQTAHGADWCALQCRLAFQEDGNLVLYKNGTPYWDSKTNGAVDSSKVLILGGASYHLEIQNSSSQSLWHSQ